MTVDAFRVLVHEVRTRLDKVAVRSSVYEAIVAEARLACFTADHAESFDELRAGLNRAVIELCLRNVLARRELVVAHDSARRALRCVVEPKALETHEIVVDASAATSVVDEAAIDLGLALIHMRDALAMALNLSTGVELRKPLVEKLDGVTRILERLEGAA